MEDDKWKHALIEYRISEYELTWGNLWIFFLKLIGCHRYPIHMADNSYTVSFWYKEDKVEVQIDELTIRK